VLSLSLLGFSGVACDGGPSSQSDDVVNVPNSDIERQSIGNCWLYATASWVEAIHLIRTGEQFDASQSYWTYWHWYGQIVEGYNDEISTGGSESVSFQIIRERGLMAEADFVPEDAQAEMSSRQHSALDAINQELKSGRLATSTARSNRKLVRQVLDEAWGLSDDVRKQLDTAFGTTGKRTYLTSATAKGTKIIRAKDFQVRYSERKTNPSAATVKDTTLKVAVDEWKTGYYPYSATDRRNFQIRVQKAMNDGQPMMISWSVDFNALESSAGPLQGSFNLDTLKRMGGPGHQGGHMTVLEDYEAVTKDFGTLKAGVTLDPTNATDKAKLDAALLPSTTVKFWRIKNSWGAFRDDRSSAPGMPGFHDLYTTYLEGPITWCPDVEGTKTASNCTGKETPWESVVFPPGY